MWSVNKCRCRSSKLTVKKKLPRVGLPQIKLTVSAVSFSQEGRFAVVTDVGSGMRWTHIAERDSLARTNGVCADGEVVWSWRSDAGAKLMETIPLMTVA